MSIFRSIIDLLSKSQTDFSLLEHEPTPTSADSARARGNSLTNGAKAIVLKVEKEFYLFVLRADMKINSKKIKQYFTTEDYKVKKTCYCLAMW